MHGILLDWGSGADALNHKVQRGFVMLLNSVSNPIVLRGKSAAICRDVNNKKRGHIDSKFKIQKFGGKIRRKRFETSLIEMLRIFTTRQQHVGHVKLSPFFVVYIAAYSSTFAAKHDRIWNGIQCHFGLDEQRKRLFSIIRNIKCILSKLTLLRKLPAIRTM